MCLSETPETLVLTIEDNGPGIPHDRQRQVFDAFVSTKPPQRGSGLGLYIAKTIVEIHHHGKLDLVSEPNQGATFIFTLFREPDFQNRVKLNFRGAPISF